MTNQNEVEVKYLTKLNYVPDFYPKDLGYKVDELVRAVNILINEIEKLKVKNAEPGK